MTGLMIILTGNLRLAVMLPEGEDLNEWIAVNTVDFFNQINMLYGTITEFCTEQSCPVMSAGPKYEVRSGSDPLLLIIIFDNVAQIY